MQKYYFKSLTLLAVIMIGIVAGCGSLNQVTEPVTLGKGMAMLKIIAATGSPFQKLAKTATLTISASDMLTITKSLKITDSSVEGTITGIPSGKSRLFAVAVYDSLDTLQYKGSASANVIADSTVKVSINVVRVAGNAIITGTITPSPGTPETLAVQLGLDRPIVMKYIPAGTFTMGSDSSADYCAQPPHQVTLSSFAMQETDVTQEQYLAVMGKNPSYFDTGTGAPLRPVEEVNWYDAVLYCNALSKLSGLDTCYTYTQSGASDAVCNFTKSGYRLPTEAQWEYACRAGSITEYWWGPDTNGMGACTWSYYYNGSTTHPVATKLANAYGLYDMTGNVFQWCNDWYGSYTAGAATDPTGAATGTSRILRGGSWANDGGAYFRSAYRNYYYDPQTFWIFSVGFRVVLPR